MNKLIVKVGNCILHVTRATFIKWCLHFTSVIQYTPYHQCVITEEKARASMSPENIFIFMLVSQKKWLTCWPILKILEKVKKPRQNF